MTKSDRQPAGRAPALHEAQRAISDVEANLEAPSDPSDVAAAVHDTVVALEKLLQVTRVAAPERESWIDVAAAAQYAACAEETIRELIASGDLPCGRLGARGIRVRRSDIDRALTRNADAKHAPPSDESGNASRILQSLHRRK